MATALGGTSASARKIVASINVNGYIAVNFYLISAGPSYGVWCARSSNSGSTWSYSQIGTNVLSNLGADGAFDYVPHLVEGHVVLYSAWGRAAVRRLYKSTDSGATWSLMQGPGALGLGSDDPNGAVVIHCPYNGNESGNIVYAGWNVRNGNGIIKSENGGTSISVITLPSNYDGPVFRRTSIETYTLNNSLVYTMGGASGDSTKFLYSDNGGSTWTEKSVFTGDAYASGGFPVNSSQFYRVSVDGIFVSTDGGANWTDKTGNFTSSIGTLDDPSPYYSGVIVPLWTE